MQATTIKYHRPAVAIQTASLYKVVGSGVSVAIWSQTLQGGIWGFQIGVLWSKREKEREKEKEFKVRKREREREKGKHRQSLYRMLLAKKR